jgi:hypothetical protein
VPRSSVRRRICIVSLLSRRALLKPVDSMIFVRIRPKGVGHDVRLMVATR